LKITFYFVAVSLLLVVIVTFPVYATTFRVAEGDALQYRYARTGSTGGSETGNVTFTVSGFNRTSLVLQVNSTGTDWQGPLHIEYRNGMPVYAERLETLVYLPPECMAESLQGKLDWVSSVQTSTLATVVNETGQTQNLTVAAGSFQTLNLTLSLVGWEYGTLNLVYSLDSGLLVYESWVPSPYGDIIVQELTGLTNPLAEKPSILDIVLPTATLILPIATAMGETGKAVYKLKSRGLGTKTESGQPKNDPFRASLYTGFIGALFILASVSLSWSKLTESQIYLPSSLPMLVGWAQVFSLSTAAFVAVSVLAHATAIVAWLSIVTSIYAQRKRLAGAIALVSAFVAFASVLILILAGWPVSWGSLIMIAGGVLMLASAFATMGKRM
jgi:hypothetical protein